jgi:hypothetical protein
MKEDWSIIDTQGPSDDVDTEQHVKLQESESLEPDASLEDPTAQDTKA